MTRLDDRAYHLKRSLDELAAAKAATDTNIAAIHRVLAALHAKRAAPMRLAGHGTVIPFRPRAAPAQLPPTPRATAI